MTLSIVDNSIEIIHRLKELLSDNQYIKKIQYAVSYTEASVQLRKNRPDIVLLDINMPENKSYRLLKEIKSGNRKTVVIVLSIHTDSVVQNMCISLGADYFFDKYHEFEKIPGIINKINGK